MKLTYRTRAIISRGLYFFYPIFTLAAAYIADNLCTKNGNSSFSKLKIRGFKSRAAYDGARTVITFVSYQPYCERHALIYTMSVVKIYYTSFFSPLPFDVYVMFSTISNSF